MTKFVEQIKEASQKGLSKFIFSLEKPKKELSIEEFKEMVMLEQDPAKIIEAFYKTETSNHIGLHFLHYVFILSATGQGDSALALVITIKYAYEYFLNKKPIEVSEEETMKVIQTISDFDVRKLTLFMLEIDSLFDDQIEELEELIAPFLTKNQ